VYTLFVTPISTTFYEQLVHQLSFAKNLQSQTVSREKVQRKTFIQKAAFKVLVKLTLY